MAKSLSGHGCRTRIYSADAMPTFLRTYQISPPKEQEHMRKAYVLMIGLFATLAAHAQNSCSTALAIAAGSHVVPGITGVETPVPICTNTSAGATAGMWYRYTSAVDTAIRITTTTTGVDTRFHVYAGVCGALACVTGDDDSGAGSTSEATFGAVAGTVYTIAFDNRWTSVGFTFQLVEVEQIILPVAPVTFTQSVVPDFSGTVLTVVDMNGDHLDDAVIATGTSIKVARQQMGRRVHELHQHLSDRAALTLVQRSSG